MRPANNVNGIENVNEKEVGGEQNNYMEIEAVVYLFMIKDGRGRVHYVTADDLYSQVQIWGMKETAVGFERETFEGDAKDIASWARRHGFEFKSAVEKMGINLSKYFPPDNPDPVPLDM